MRSRLTHLRSALLLGLLFPIPSCTDGGGSKEASPGAVADGSGSGGQDLRADKDNGGAGAGVTRHDGPGLGDISGGGGSGGDTADSAQPPNPLPTADPDTAPAASCPAGTPFPKLKRTTVAMVSRPIHLVGHPDEPDTIFILERGGRVRLLKDGMLVANPVFSVSPAAGAERGALSLALHPRFPENGRMFIFVTLPDSTVEEWKRASPETATATRVGEIYRHPHGASNHQGGNIAFGPDGFLYVSIGDNRTPRQSADPNSRYGKILRMDADTKMPATGNPNESYTWDWGLRNPWRISFDRLTGDLLIADVGEGSTEWIYRQPKGRGGTDWGWPGSPGGAKALHQYPRSVGACVIGGYVYRGKKHPCLEGRYFWGDHRSGTVRSFLISGAMATDHRTHDAELGGGGIYSFGEDGRGELYILRENGQVARIDAE